MGLASLHRDSVSSFHSPILTYFHLLTLPSDYHSLTSNFSVYQLQPSALRRTTPSFIIMMAVL
jgi:hypothetical protein